MKNYHTLITLFRYIANHEPETVSEMWFEFILCIVI